MSEIKPVVVNPRGKGIEGIFKYEEKELTEEDRIRMVILELEILYDIDLDWY